MSINVIIIEDESSATRHLENLLQAIDRPFQIIATLSSVEQAVQWLRTKPHPDLLFMDIHLSDGLSFDILEEVAVECAIIFTTAYDQYAIQAFKTTGIDYLLKPITQADLEQSLSKFTKLQQKFNEEIFLQNLDILLQKSINTQQEYKQQFLLKSANALVPVSIDQIAYFYREDLVFARTFKQQSYVMDESLNYLQTQLDPKQFLRLNRKFLVNKSAIKKLIPTKPGRLQIKVEPTFQQEIHLSQERSSWLRRVLES